MSLVITGGQSGIDTWTLKWALDNGYNCKVLFPLDKAGQIIRQNLKDDTLDNFYTFFRDKIEIKTNPWSDKKYFNPHTDRDTKNVLETKQHNGKLVVFLLDIPETGRGSMRTAAKFVFNKNNPDLIEKRLPDGRDQGFLLINNLLILIGIKHLDVYDKQKQIFNEFIKDCKCLMFSGYCASTYPNGYEWFSYITGT